MDISTVVDEISGSGTVFLNSELHLEGHAHGSGLVRPATSTYIFRRAGAAWLCVRYQAIPGISPSIQI